MQSGESIMPKISKKSEKSCIETAPPIKEKNLRFIGNKASIVTVGMIAIMAFVIRAAFSFSTSMDLMFALSGGSEASEHLCTVVQILEGNNVSSGNPIVIDFIIAHIASSVMGIVVSPIVAASFVLGTFSILCGTLTVVIAYILGLEVTGTKKAGYLTAIFMAFCPVVISQTIFSNGTEVGWHLLLITTFFTLFIKGIKSFNILSKEDKLSDIVKSNHQSMKFGLISGAILALIAISTSSFRPVFIILIFIMVAAVIIDRIRNIDSRLPTLYFSVIIFIGMIVATAYYIPANQWDNVLSGIFIATVFGVVICAAFSMLQTRSYTITIPVFIIITLVFFIVLAIITPNLFNSVVYGNNGYSQSVSKLFTGTISISQMSTFFGPVALWFSLLMVASMLINIRKNVGSHTHIAVFMIMTFGTYYGWRSQSYATMFSFVFAIGFAYVMIWLFNSIDFKTYFASFKTANFKTFWKKLIKPVPFISMLSIIFLLIVPNAIYAVDGSVFVNQKDDTYGTYDVRMNVNNALLDYQQHSDKSGAMVCWFKNSSDVSTFGKFNTITDAKGNGAAAVSNILLSNGADGSSTSAMLIYTLKHTGFNNEIKDKLEKAGLKEKDYEDLKKIVDSPQEFRSYVIGNVYEFGIINPYVSDEGISYLYGKWFLTKKYDGFTISKMYDALADRCKISCLMIDGSLFPNRHSSLFNEISISGGYETKEFIGISYLTKHRIVFPSYTDKMYDTFLWRAYIGMSPKEAGITSVTDYFKHLMLSDGKYKAQPGYGFSNYVLDYDHWFVMYNPDKNAKISSDGWTKMLYNKAIAEQKKNGGLINYLSGLPMFFKYSPNSDGKIVSGTVSCCYSDGVKEAAKVGVKGVRVSAIDSDGVIRSTTHTDNEGKFKINIIDLGSTINFYSGSNNLSDGTLIKTVNVVNNYDAQICNVEIPKTSVNGKFVDKNNDVRINVKVVMKGKTTGAEVLYFGPSEKILIKNIFPDVYDVTITSPDEKITYIKEKVTVVAGANYDIAFKEKTNKVKLIFEDESKSRLLFGKEVSLVDTISNISHTSKVSYNGTAIYNVPNGNYKIKIDKDHVCMTETISVDANKLQTITVMPSKTFDLRDFPGNKVVIFYNSGYLTSEIADDQGSLSINLPKGTSGRTVYSAYSFDGDKVYTAKLDTAKSSASVESGDGVRICGKLETSSGATDGTILFIKDDLQIPVHSSSDNGYSVLLREGEYTVYAYANDKSDVVIESFTVVNNAGDTINYNIKLEPGKFIKVNASCHPINRQMCYLPFNVNVENHNLTFVTDKTGAYKFNIPTEKCKIKILLDEDSIYSINDSSNNVEVTDKADFKLSVDNLNVHNSTGHPIKINNVEIKNDSEAKVKVTSCVLPIKIDYIENSNRFYFEGYMSTPSTKNIIIQDTFPVVGYYPLTIKNADDYKINVDPIDNGKKIDESNGTYYLQNGKKFRVTAIKNDFTEVLYRNISKTETINVKETSKPMVTLTGYVGSVGNGKITVTIGDEKFDFGLDTSGHYKIFVPKCDLKLSALIENKDRYGNVISSYIASDDLKCSNWEGEKVYNLAVTGGKNNSIGEIKIEPSVNTSLVGEDVTEITFSLHLSKPDNETKTTYTISGGSGWSCVSFYSDQGMKNKISSVNIDNDTIIYGKGTVSGSKVRLSSENLSIILKNLNGKVCGTGVFNDPKTINNKTVNEKTIHVHAGIDSIVGQDCLYGFQITNENNYTKEFKISHEQIKGDWHKTYCIRDEIMTDELDHISVPGYATMAAHLKLTPKYEPSEIPRSVKFTIVTDNDENIRVTAFNDVDTFDSQTTLPAIDIIDSSANGRNVVNDVRGMPITLWIIVILVIVLLFVTIWEASRRGVFTRRK